jgi:hypothetical protein
MGSIADYLENIMLDYILNHGAFTPPTNLVVGLSSADPLDDASGITEPSGGNYARVSVVAATLFSVAAAARQISSQAGIIFPQASGSWGANLTHYFICDHLTNTNFGTDVHLLAHGSLAVAKGVVAGNTPSIASGEITISFKDLATKANGQNISDYLANAILDYAFRHGAGNIATPPATYLGYATADLVDGSTGASITEVANSNGYARKLVDVNGGASPTWKAAVGNLVENLDNIENGPPSGSWGLITALFLADLATHGAGNILFYDNNLTEQTPNDGDTVRVAAGALDLSLT